MADSGGTARRASRILLLVAGAAAVSAVTYAVTRQPSARPVPAPTATMTAPDAGADPQAAIRALQDQVGAHPEDGVGWRKLGQAYSIAERYGDASRAYRRASALLPRDAAIWSAYGEATVMASAHDPMPAEALAAFTKAHNLDPRDARSRYFLAVARDLKGDHRGAIDDWLALLADTPADAPWRADLIRTIEQVGRINHIAVASRLPAAPPAPVMPADDPVATGGIPGPSAEQMHAAAALPKGAQDQMIAGMVDGLEAKLRTNPANIDGWIMLMRSRMTLGERAKAMAARDAALAANPGAAARINSAAATLGVAGK